MDKQEQAIQEMSLLNDVKGESTSPFNNSMDNKVQDDLLISLKYLQDHYPQEYKENDKRLSLMLEEILPLSIRQIVEWGEVSLKEQKDVFQNTTLLIKENSSLNGAEIIDEIINRQKEKKSGFFSRMIKSLKFSKEQEDKNNIEDLKVNLSLILTQINQSMERLEGSRKYIKLRLIILIAINESLSIKNSSLLEAIENRRQLFFYALQNIEVSKVQLEQTKDMILKHLVSIDHIEKVTIPLLHRVKE
ncbi:hypothetical protein ACTOJ1_000077 [Shigella flexneri]